MGLECEGGVRGGGSRKSGVDSDGNARVKSTKKGEGRRDTRYGR